MGVEEVLQELAEESREKERQKTEAALAAGFSCLEEYEQKRAEEWQQMIDEFEDFAKEQCLITGQSMEQFMAERFQAPPDPQKNSFLPILEPCDCQGESLSPSLILSDANKAQNTSILSSALNHLLSTSLRTYPE